jgi:hypothetical protein
MVAPAPLIAAEGASMSFMLSLSAIHFSVAVIPAPSLTRPLNQIIRPFVAAMTP